MRLLKDVALRTLNMVTPDQILAIHMAPIDGPSYLAGLLTFLIWAHFLGIIVRESKNDLTK